MGQAPPNGASETSRQRRDVLLFSLYFTADGLPEKQSDIALYFHLRHHRRVWSHGGCMPSASNDVKRFATASSPLLHGVRCILLCGIKLDFLAGSTDAATGIAWYHHNHSPDYWAVHHGEPWPRICAAPRRSASLQETFISQGAASRRLAL